MSRFTGARFTGAVRAARWARQAAQARDADSLRRIRQQRLLPAGGVALTVGMVSDLVLDSAVLFGTALVAVLVVAALMSAAWWLEGRTAGPEFSEITGFSTRGDVP